MPLPPRVDVGVWVMVDHHLAIQQGHVVGAPHRVVELLAGGRLVVVRGGEPHLMRVQATGGAQTSW